MTKPDDTTRLRHMLDSALDAVEFLGDLSLEEFQKDKKLLNAIVRSLEIIGEAASNVTEAMREEHPEIEWPVIIGMRNRIVHAYYDINSVIVWKTVKENLPPLIEKLRSILN